MRYSCQRTLSQQASFALQESGITIDITIHFEKNRARQRTKHSKWGHGVSNNIEATWSLRQAYRSIHVSKKQEGCCRRRGSTHRRNRAKRIGATCVGMIYTILSHTSERDGTARAVAASGLRGGPFTGPKLACSEAHAVQSRHGKTTIDSGYRYETERYTSTLACVNSTLGTTLTRA